MIKTVQIYGKKVVTLCPPPHKTRVGGHQPHSILRQVNLIFGGGGGGGELEFFSEGQEIFSDNFFSDNFGARLFFSPAGLFFYNQKL